MRTGGSRQFKPWLWHDGNRMLLRRAAAGPCLTPSLLQPSGVLHARPASAGAACRRAATIPRTQDVSSSGTAWQLCCCARISCASPRGVAFWHLVQSRREGVGRTGSRSTAPLAARASFCCHQARQPLRHPRRSSSARILQSRAAGVPAGRPPVPCRPGTVHTHVTGQRHKKDCSGRPGTGALPLLVPPPLPAKV